MRSNFVNIYALGRARTVLLVAAILSVLAGCEKGAGGEVRDPVIYQSGFHYDDRGFLAGKVSYADPGPDGTPITADDGISSYTLVRYDSNGSRTAEVFYSDAGADGIWMTGDDRVSF